MTENKLLVLDKDGTLSVPVGGATFVDENDPYGQRILEGVIDVLDRHREAGWTIAIASNQGGIAAGHRSRDSVIKDMSYIMNMTGIDYSMFAPSYETDGVGLGVQLYIEDRCLIEDPIKSRDGRLFRKPEPGMLLHIKENLRPTGEEEMGWDPIMWDKCYMVGDREEDMIAARKAGFTFVWANAWRANKLEGQY